MESEGAMTKLMYNLPPMVSLAHDIDNAGIDTRASNDAQTDEANDPAMQRRWEKIQNYWKRYQDVLSKTGMADTREARETAAWVRATQKTSRREIKDSIVWREEFFEGYAKDIIEKGLPLYEKFRTMLDEAKPFISKKSKQEWMERLRDNSVMDFQGKKYWIEHQFPDYISRWKKVAEERDELVKNPELKEIVAMDQKFAVILDRDKFLDLHYNERVGRLAKAKALMYAMEKGRKELYAKAEKKLGAAAFMGAMADHKIGMWLKRIFKSNASEKKIAEFINGSGFNSLTQMIDRWAKLKFRFDMLKDKAKKLDQDSAARGLNIMSENQFLNMHYAQRLRYVEELDQRINGAKDINNERPIFIQIRHAMDTKDWDDATELIQDAKLMQLTEKERERLGSMERFTNQFKPKNKKEKKIVNGMDLIQVRQRIDTLVGEIGEHHTEMQPMVKRLLMGRKANRSINQLRWMAYNEWWCEKHGYLNYKIAKYGASKHNEEMTRECALQGKDMGRHNNIGHTTAGQQYFRKTEIVRHKATFEHLNVKNESATMQVAEWCEHEQSPKDLYWRTLCCHTDGEPKSSNWHQDWFRRLTELRSLTRILENAGYKYAGLGEEPELLNTANLISNN